MTARSVEVVEFSNDRLEALATEDQLDHLCGMCGMRTAQPPHTACSSCA